MFISKLNLTLVLKNTNVSNTSEETALANPQGRYYDICIHTYGSGHFWGFKILNFNIFGGFQKNRYFLGYEDFVDIFGAITKLDYI